MKIQLNTPEMCLNTTLKVHFNNPKGVTKRLTIYIEKPFKGVHKAISCCRLIVVNNLTLSELYFRWLAIFQQRSDTLSPVQPVLRPLQQLPWTFIFPTANFPWKQRVSEKKRSTKMTLYCQSRNVTRIIDFLFHRVFSISSNL